MQTGVSISLTMKEELQEVSRGSEFSPQDNTDDRFVVQAVQQQHASLIASSALTLAGTPVQFASAPSKRDFFPRRK